MADIDERALESVVKQFRGGEHALAGQRAGQLIYGSGSKPDEAFLQRLTTEAPGIERYIAPPADPVPPIEDQGGNPLATQPENDPQQLNPSNMSPDQSKAEQAEIDKRLAAGRKVAEESDAEGTPAADETKLNPEEPDVVEEEAKAKSRRSSKRPN